jgi:hypothetical protein
MQQSEPWRIKGGKLITDNGEPQTIHELSEHRQSFGNGPTPKVFTR